MGMIPSACLPWYLAPEKVITGPLQRRCKVCLIKLTFRPLQLPSACPPSSCRTLDREKKGSPRFDPTARRFFPFHPMIIKCNGCCCGARRLPSWGIQTASSSAESIEPVHCKLPLAGRERVCSQDSPNKREKGRSFLLALSGRRRRRRFP